MPERRDFVGDWKAFRADDIPSKGIRLPSLFFNTLHQLEGKGEDQSRKKLRILELGCGCGDLSALLSNEMHHIVVGTDINEEGIQRAKLKCPDADFAVVNATSETLAKDVRQHTESPVNESFDFVVLQLLLSIVGGPEERQATLRNARELCRSGGRLYLSCSGVSSDINEKYAKLYEQDKLQTGEEYTYLSRDSETGNILYSTHHFQEDELTELLTTAGFEDITIEKVREHSSRRKGEAAYFFYVAAMRS